MKAFHLLFTLCFITACQTQDTPTPAPTRHSIVFRNKSGIPVNYSFHATRESYNANTNAIARLRIEHNASDSIDIAAISSFDSIYVDIYSEDRIESNFVTDIIAYSSAGIISGNEKIGISRSWGDSLGIHYLGANRESLTWTAIGYRDYPNDIWSTLPEYRKHFSIKLNKEGTFVIQKKDSLNNDIIIKGSFQRSPVNMLLLWDSAFQEYHVEPIVLLPGIYTLIWVREGGFPRGYICELNQ